MELITGNKFKKACHYSLDEYGFARHSEPNEDEILRIFVKIDYVHNFFRQKQNRPYILVTHNGDIPVDDNYLRYMDDPFLIKWYGQNIMTIHLKLESIPIGIANEKWSHGNEDVFKEVMGKNIEKERLIYVNFDVNTNRAERNYCVSELNKKGLEMQPKLPFKEYLEEVAKSYFVVSPNGNGVDCHKTWEGLYLKTIPIVTQSINIDYYKNLPIIVINDWSDLKISDYNIDLYNKKINNFKIDNIYINKITKLK
jgi:hypothetical protein